jgi:hypothetical protein
MRILKSKLPALCLLSLCALLLAAGVMPANAQMSGQHPNYLHAIRDLREARGLLQHNFTEPAHAKAASSAIPHIDEAINDLKRASKLDDKSLGAVPPPDNKMPDPGRFHKVSELLGAAHQACDGPDSDASAVPERDKAQKHIDAAAGIIKTVL